MDVADTWETCPRCGSQRVKKQGYWRALGMLLAGFSGGCLFLVLGLLLLSVSAVLGAPFIGIGALFVLAGVFIYFATMFRGRICLDCNHRWFEKKKAA